MRERRNGGGRVAARFGPSTRAGTDGSSSRPKPTARSAGAGADDGRELLALQVLPNKTDWVLWTPEGFYEATPGAQDVLKWVTNHGPDSAATTLPVSAIAKLHRPDALPLVLQELETARALGIADLAAARVRVQTATGSAKPPGGVLHVLAIGVDKFGDKAGGLHLDYAAEDARDVANALLESQKVAPGKPSLYADVSVQYLPNDQAGHTDILDALDAMARSMRTSGPDQDVAVILVSSHGEMIDGQFYLIPYGFDAGSPNASTTSAVSASEFAKKVKALAEHGKVLLLLDACHSGAVGAGGWATDPDAKVLQDAMDMENVTVLTSSKKNELSQELPVWRHGAFTQAFLDALSGAADPEGHGHHPAVRPDRRDGGRTPATDQGPAAPRPACQFRRRPVRGEPLRGAPRPMKTRAIASPTEGWSAPQSGEAAARLRCFIREQSPHHFRVAFDGQQQRAGRGVRGAPMLLPIPQRRDGQMEGFRKFRLCHSKTPSQHFDARHASHLCQLVWSERLRIGVGKRGDYDLLVGHGVEPRPIGVAPRERVTRFHGHPRSTGLAHVSWPSGPI